MSRILVNLFHIFAIGPLLIYIGSNENKTNVLAYTVLGVFALMIPFIVHIPSFNLRSYNLILLLHWLVFDIFFLYIALSQNNTPKFLYPFILILGLCVITIHLYYAMRQVFSQREGLEQDNIITEKNNKLIKNGVIDCSIIHPSSIEFVNLLHQQFINS